MGTLNDFDRVRDRELNKYLDGLYESSDAPAESWNMTPRERAIQQHENLRTILAEIREAKEMTRRGRKVDYVELAGGILDFADEIDVAITYFLEA